MNAEQTLEAISKYWISTVFATILLVVFLKYAFDTLKIILYKLDIVIDLITKRELQDYQTIWVFKAVLSENIHKKLMVAKQKLVENNLKTRRQQIEQALSTQFYKIIQEESQFLSTFITPAWDIWKILWELLAQDQWINYMNLIYWVFFWEWEINTKLSDLSNIMNEVVNNMVAKIETRINNWNNPK